MTNVNYIIDDSIVNRLTDNRKWLDSYVPSVSDRLKTRGFDVVFDRKSDFDLMHIHVPMTLAYRLLHNNNNGNSRPIIFHGHMTEDTFLVGARVKYLVRKWFKNLAQKSDVILCPSWSAAEYFNGILPGKDIRQLNYGIDLDKYTYSESARKNFRELNGIHEDKVVVSCVGGLTRRKGIDDFCEVAGRFPDLQFMWMGGSFYKDQTMNSFYSMISRGDNMNIKAVPENVMFMGYTPDIPDALSASDMFFFPSRHETQGLALVEAAANGLPIVARDLPVFREWLTHGIDSLMGTDVDEFTDHIRSLSQDVGLSLRLGKQALKSARKYHDINLTSQMLAEIYLELTG